MKKLILCIFFIVPQFFYAQKKEILPAKEALILSKNFQQKASWFTDMPQYNLDSSDYYANKGLKILNIKEPLHQNQYLSLAFKNLKNNNQRLSIAAQDSLTKIKWNDYKDLDFEVAKNRFLQYDYLIYWAKIKLRKGEPKESLALFEKALKLINKNDPPYIIARMTLDKALYYGLYGLDSEKKIAIKYLQESLKFYKSNYKDYPAEYYMANAELQYHYTNTLQDSANYYFHQIKLILDYYKKPTVHIWYYSSLGANLIADKKFEEAKTNIQKAITIMELYDMQSDSYSYCLERLADIDIEQNKYDNAIANYHKAYEVYNKNGDHYGAINALKNIGDSYQKKGDLANALEFKDQYYNESLTAEKKLNNRSLRESELKVAVLTRDKELIQKSNLQIIYLIVLGIGAIVLLLVYRNVRLKQKNNKKLAFINLQLENKNHLLDKRNEDNELLLKEIHHRVKNNLEVVSGLLALQSSQIDDQSTKDAMQESQNRVNSIGIVHQKLYQGVNLGAVEMKDYLLNLSESILDSFGATGKINLELAMEHLDLDIDTAVPLGLIINELITNTVKYAFPNDQNGTLTIKLEKQIEKNMLHLVVSDNGVGKSGNIQGTGFGGQLISLLTNQLNGTMTEENHDGTTVIFDFKMKKVA